MFRRRCFLLLAWLATLLPGWHHLASGQENPTDADQVIAKYLNAIGADKFPSMTTFVEKGVYTGSLAGLAPTASPFTQGRATFEFYFKQPNLRLSFVRMEDNTVAEMHGCDGKVAWYIVGKERRDFKPQPGKQGACEDGYVPMPVRLRGTKIKLQLEGQKRLGDRMAWAVRVQDPKSPTDETDYFDAQTYLLVRREAFHMGGLPMVGLSMMGGVSKVEWLYSDYREVNGIEIPFIVTERIDGTVALVTTLREVTINAPIDEGWFQEPTIQRTANDQQTHVDILPVPTLKPREGSPTLPVSAGTATSLAVGPPAMDAAQTAAYLVDTSFATCPIADLQQTVPELRGLKIARNQEELPALLDKIGDKTVSLFRKTPDLISDEQVLESRVGRKTIRRRFAYLILSHPTAKDVTLEEYRMDLPQETADAGAIAGVRPSPGGSASFWDDLRRSSQQASARETGSPPLAEGFAYMWVNFYPSNRSQSNFRYLGQQKIDRHNTFVVAFSQKPQSVRMPGEIRLKGKSVPVFYQGVAWFDESDFRIVRLRTDLLLPLTEVPLNRLTSEIHFADTRVAGLAPPLWLPRQVSVAALINGTTFTDVHSYSHYRLYAAHSRLLLNP